ncbi:uncharacterized protein LOC144573808 [Carex rostrata]
MLTLWLFYVTSDFVATLALGNILGKQIDYSGSSILGDLTALWAPFLLVHLGGPDPITSYSVEDNELWWRHLLGLIVQVFTAGFVFLQSLPNHRLWVPTLFVFVPGLLKYGERTLALRSASMDNFKDKIISDLFSRGDDPQDYSLDLQRQYNRLRLGPDVFPDLSNESSFILEGYHWFEIFKRLMVDMTFSSDILIYSQNRFGDIIPEDAFKLVAIELSFLYDILYTKSVIIHSISGRVVRCCSLISIVAAFIVFHDLDKVKFKPTDITVTYILLAAGLSLEVVAAVLLVISDWTIVSLSKSRCFMNVYLQNSIVWIVNWTFRKGKPRWSRAIRQYNLVAFCLRNKHTLIGRIMSVVKVKNAWDNMRATKMILLPHKMEEMMFEEAKRRAPNVDTYKILLEARSYRGLKALERHGQLENLEWSMKREFDVCIILWHVATDICFYNEYNREYTEHVDMCTEAHVSCLTSNYMLYLLILQPSMTQFGFGKTRFEATCAVIKQILKGERKLDHKKAHEVLQSHHVSVPPVLEPVPPVLEPVPNVNPVLYVNGQNEMGRLVLKDKWICWGRRKGEENEENKKRKDEYKGEENKKREYEKKGKLVLRDGLRLARELQKIQPEIRWQLISETWMEMLGYAAIHCNSYEHAKSLSRGGELLTHFWLLMAHMGVVDEHKIQQYEHKIQPTYDPELF